MKLCASLLIIVAALPSLAQITVTVDGREVNFVGAGPTRVDGRVMVPLRGVLEAMGAYVEFQSSTGSILAQKGDTVIRMRLGDRTARVNDREVTLEVPAMSLSGRTMVPLRFVGEALGADVKWNGATQTVTIVTSPAAAGAIIEITGIDVRLPAEWMKPGDVLEVTLEGTPGATALFRIPGLVDRVSMTEESSGVYVGKWTVPRDTNLSGARILGELTMGGVSRLIQAGGLVNVDSSAPKITNVIPEARSRVPSNRLSVSAVFDDGAGSGIDVSTVAVIIDGTEVTDTATVTSSFVTWRPERALAAGRHTASVSARDKAGNAVARSWEFTVSDATSAVQSFTVEAPDKTEPGDVITVTLRGERGATVTFAIGEIKNIPMRESEAGIYRGEYTVKRGDSLSNAAVIATVRTAAGETYTVEADKRINAAPSAQDAPIITSHKDGDAVGSPIVLSGTAKAGSKVRIKVEYATTVIGGIRLTGAISEMEVSTSAQGKWTTDPIDLKLLITGEDTTYKVTATLVVPEGQKPLEPTIITLKKK